MKRTRTIAIATLLSFILAVTAGAVEFPQGTLSFFDSGAEDAVPALGGGIWVSTSEGLVRYTEAGPGALLPTPGGGPPLHLVLAADGSIWFAAETLIARISPEGQVLEQYPVTSVRALEVASDGALWYGRADSMGRIAGGVRTQLRSLTPTWSLAPAANGEMWVLGSGIGTNPDTLYRMTPTGAATTLPLGHDVLFGRLQALPDGTLYIGTGNKSSVLRLTPGEQTVAKVDLPGSKYLSDSSGNLWTAGHEVLGYISRLGKPNVSVPMPADPRACENIPVYLYEPVAFDTTGGLWVRVVNDVAEIPAAILCLEPEPPLMPDLIRIDTATFLAIHAPGYGRRRGVSH
jgi:ligand-binding sensor domain-containing protein